MGIFEIRNSKIRLKIDLKNADTFFLKELQSVAHLVEIFNTFPDFSELKPNLREYEP